VYVSYCHPTAAAMLFLISVPTSGREHINGWLAGLTSIGSFRTRRLRAVLKEHSTIWLVQLMAPSISNKIPLQPAIIR